MVFYTRYMQAKIKIVLLVLIVRRSSADVDIQGEVSLYIKAPVVRSGADQVVIRFGQSSGQSDHVTAGSVLECSYQYPEKEQVDAILSNMMNKLTKVFVRAHDFFADEETRRGIDTRFRVVDEKKAQFFEHIYHNMTKEYSKLYELAAEGAGREAACRHQREARASWRALLDHSLATFRRAALTAVAEQLRILKSDEKTKNRLSQFLVRELAKIRTDQLHLLCDQFQLCYNDLQT